MGPAVPVFRIYRVVGDEADGLWWRMISPNGRGIAQIATASETPQDARDSILRVAEQAGEFEQQLRLTGEHRWRWSLLQGGRPVVLGIGAHDRRLRCQGAIEHFIELAPIASIEPTVFLFHRGSESVRVARRMSR